jgi:hypothetical protein
LSGSAMAPNEPSLGFREALILRDPDGHANLIGR